MYNSVCCATLSHGGKADCLVKNEITFRRRQPKMIAQIESPILPFLRISITRKNKYKTGEE